MPLTRPDPISVAEVPPGWDSLTVGQVRPQGPSGHLRGLHLDHHPTRTEQTARWIRSQARQRFGLSQVFFAHRVGWVEAGEPIVILAAWSHARRRDAQSDPGADADAACRWMLEATKRHLPVWKAEEGGAGLQWVAGTQLVWPGPAGRRGLLVDEEEPTCKM